MRAAQGEGDPPLSGSSADDFGGGRRARDFLRRRLGLALFRLGHPRIHLGTRCDVRSGGLFLVSRGAVVRFGARCVIDRGFTLECRGRLEVGEGTVFGHHCTVAADRSIDIGRDCLFAELVSIRDHDHAFADPSTAIIDQGRSTAPIRIGDNVWVGAKATITRGVTIGSNTVVGAHAVVTRDLPANSVAVGVPARVVRMRDGGAVGPE